MACTTRPSSRTTRSASMPGRTPSPPRVTKDGGTSSSGNIRPRRSPRSRACRRTRSSGSARSVAQPRVDFAGTEHFPLAGKVYQGVPDFLLGRADVDGERFEAPYPLKAILTYYTNPLFSTPDATRWGEAIATVPFVLTFSPFLDATTSMADLV